MTHHRLKQSQQRQPTGGHHIFTNNIMFKGESAPDVAEKVAEYRLINSIPEGDPEAEIVEYYAKKFPWMVEKHMDWTAPPPKNQRYEWWSKWIRRTWRSPPPDFAATQTASERQEVCKTCPFMKSKSWKETSESMELEKRAYLLRRSGKISEEIGICGLHKADIGVLSYSINPAKLCEEPTKAPPEKCWVKPL